jgi:hypothetical protein
MKGDFGMKLWSKSLIAGALLMLMAPMAAQARDFDFHRGYCRGWGHYDIYRDRRDIRHDWRDVGRDRFFLHRDLANGNWAAARFQRADIRNDLRDIHGDRWDLYRDHRFLPYGY